MKNYYETLGITEQATQEDIKKAYRKLSKQYHPDVNPDGEEKFKEVSEAYENIGEESKRVKYDQMRKNPFANMNGGGFDINDLFEQMVNGGRQRQPKAPDKVISLNVSSLESYFGSKKEILLNNNLVCDPCAGSGGDKMVCETCKGNGFIIQTLGTNMFTQQFQVTCPSCNGYGAVISNPCKSCNGNGVKQNQERIAIILPQNSDNGDFIRLKGLGDYYPNIKMRGDLIVKVNLINDDKFEKSGKDLVYKITLTPVEYLLNDKMIIEHPDGDLSVNMPETLTTEKPLRIPNKGYKYQDGNGHFYIKLVMEKTKNLDSQQKEKLKSILE